MSSSSHGVRNLNGGLECAAISLRIESAHDRVVAFLHHFHHLDAYEVGGFVFADVRHSRFRKTDDTEDLRFQIAFIRIVAFGVNGRGSFGRTLMWRESGEIGLERDCVFIFIIQKI